MAKVITFSRAFPKYHPKAGQPTYFVEKMLNAFDKNYMEFHTLENWRKLNNWQPYDPENLWSNLWDLNVGNQSVIEKHHTIRAGNRWKVGDKFSPRIWSGKPYNSRQIIIAPDIEIKKVWEVKIRFKQTSPVMFIVGVNNGRHIVWDEQKKVAANDGLTSGDFMSWFSKAWEFDGQIICWNDKINY